VAKLYTRSEHSTTFHSVRQTTAIALDVTVAIENCLYTKLELGDLPLHSYKSQETENSQRDRHLECNSCGTADRVYAIS